MKPTKYGAGALFAFAMATFATSYAYATQETPLPPDVIIVTAQPRPVTRLDSSVSVSVLDETAIAAGVPRTTAEIFRQIPGLRSEASGGEGNANIAVRGLPVASGGAKFVQLQEDGLPVLQFGDIAFGNADIFLRADRTIGSIQAVRGGSASTLASNAPGGVINLISKDGSTPGGIVAARVGLDYGEYRLDADYGGALGPDTRFNLGGFWRRGEGTRRAGYDGNRGYQVKANVTQAFTGGHIRLTFKRLEDRSIGYLPMPVKATGTNANPRYGAVGDFDSRSDTVHSVLFTRDVGLDGNNRLRTADIRDGMHPVITSLGLEAAFSPMVGLHIEDRFRWSDAHGRFVSPFPAQVGDAGSVAASVGEMLTGAAGSYGLAYANGPNVGQVYAGANPVMRIHLFNVDVDDLGSFVNDLKVTGTLGPAAITAGFYKARQKIAMAWVWNSYLMEIKGHNAALLDVTDGSEVLTRGGLYAYGVPYWGNCCQRRYNVRYDIDAPYLSGTLDLGGLTLDASVRRDRMRARGRYYGTAQASNYDADGSGTIEPVERSVLLVDSANPRRVDYAAGYWSWSAGANWRVAPDAAVFARASRGGRANADRLLDSRVRADGSVRRSDAVNFVEQYELGLKYRSGPFSAFTTAFRAITQEQNYEATSQRTLDRTYHASGIELEAEFRAGRFALQGGATYTDAKISRDAITPENEGHRPRRQAKLIWQGTATVDLGRVRAGLNLVGTSDSYAQDSNELVMPGYVQVNAFAHVRMLERLELGLEANNLFDTAGYTEMEEGAIPANGYVRARSITGRTVSMSVTYVF